MDVHDVTVMGNVPEKVDTIDRHVEGTRHVREHSIHPPDTHTNPENHSAWIPMETHLLPSTQSYST